MKAVRAEAGEFAALAIIFTIAVEIVRSDFIADHVLFQGVNSSPLVEKELAIDELSGEFDRGEQGGRFSQVETTGDDSLVDAGDGELNTSSVFGNRQLQPSEPYIVGYGAKLGVEVTELATLESGRRASEPIGFDVATLHKHGMPPGENGLLDSKY